ncbi:L-rhamnose mutarotase [Fulvivirgaceae bacterium BMA12]|uniref:L-rhamnose mutarotase n=1 Tax=Agaribacillus aureus TaxID=3051825 RepID=A0ABT8L7J6_9BACT|nr:L-rhamnose mutarotase [Fulvivirgaceae bacterium BMA12]
MKNLLYLLVAFSLITACNQQKKGEQKSGASTEKTTSYADDQYRRFTYFFQTEEQRIKDFFQSTEWKQVREKINSKEILDLKVYNKDSDYFLVIDAVPELNSYSLFDLLAKEPVFSALVEILESNEHQFPAHDKALERIYKLEQRVAYSPVDGQLKTKAGNYKRFVWTLLLEEDPELMAEYRKVHGIGMAWPEITNNMKTIGVKDMEIYLYESQAILIMDTKPDFDLEEVGPKWQQLPREQEWQEYVGKFQRTDPESSIQEKWKTMNLY